MIGQIKFTMLTRFFHPDSFAQNLYPFSIKTLLGKALTTKINDREMFMKGIDYSYYYEENAY